MRRIVTTAVLVAGLLAAAVTDANAAALVPLTPNASSWGSAPIFATSPPGDLDRVFVAEREGGIRIVKHGTLLPAPFLTVPNVDTNGERGLESIAFAPDYATSHLFYVFAVIAGSPAQVQVIEYQASADPDVANLGSARIVLAQNMSSPYHNGGQLAFGPDGLLYITIGENQVSSNAQTLSNVLGKVLRIDPRKPAGPGSYTIPADNPFVGVGGARGEIWALGLRNPFRAWFTRDGRLIIADVGESSKEELDFGAKGANYGWPTCEADSCGGSHPEFASPFFTYPHGSESCAVIGGHYVYDYTLTGLYGRYIYGDLCGAGLRSVSLVAPGGDPQSTGVDLGGSGTLFSLGQDARGCSYVLANATAYRLAPSAGDSPACSIVPLEQGSGRAKLRTTHLKASRSWRIRVKVSCSGPTECAGNLSIASARSYRIAGKRQKATVGSRGFTRLAVGKSKVLSLRVPRKSRKFLMHHRKLKVSIGLTSFTTPIETLVTRRGTLRTARRR